MKYHFKVHKNRNRYWAGCIELKGCNTEGDTLKDLVKKMETALNIYLDEPLDSMSIFPLPDKSFIKAKEIYEIPVKPEIAFAFVLRQYRLKIGMSQRLFAQKLGFKNLFSYQRLERSGNPTLKTLVMIKKSFPEIPIEEVLGEM